MQLKREITIDKGYIPIGYLFIGDKRIGRCGIQIGAVKNGKNGTTICYSFSYKTYVYVVDSSVDLFMGLVSHEAEKVALLFHTWDRRDIAKKFCAKMNEQFDVQRGNIELRYVEYPIPMPNTRTYKYE